MVSEEQPTLYSGTALPWITVTSDVSGQPHDSVMHLEAKHLENRKMELFKSTERQWSMKKSTYPSDSPQSPHVWCHVGQTLKWVETSFTFSYVAVVLCLPYHYLPLPQLRGGRPAVNSPSWSLTLTLCHPPLCCCWRCDLSSQILLCCCWPFFQISCSQGARELGTALTAGSQAAWVARDLAL